VASLIGNIVILLIVIIVFQKVVGSSSTMNDKTREILKILDTNLSEKQTKKNKRKNFTDYCTAKDFLLAASIIRHQDAAAARKDMNISNKRAEEIARKLLKEMGEAGV